VHPALTVKQIKDLNDKSGVAIGEQIMKVATEGNINEVR
jgi:hypothetical protein